MILTLFEFDLNSLCTGEAFYMVFDSMGGCELLICVVDKSQSKQRVEVVLVDWKVYICLSFAWHASFQRNLRATCQVVMRRIEVKHAQMWISLKQFIFVGFGAACKQLRLVCKCFCLRLCWICMLSNPASHFRNSTPSHTCYILTGNSVRRGVQLSQYAPSVARNTLNRFSVTTLVGR